MSTTTRPSHATVSTLRKLSDLIESARTLHSRALKPRRSATCIRDLRHIIATLDAARTALIQEGEEYVEAAVALVDEATRRLLAIAIYLGGR